VTKSINFTFIPTTPLWLTTPHAYFANYRRQLEAHKAAGVAVKAEPAPVVAKGREVPLDTVVKRTKTGQWNTQSTFGKVVALLDALGWELKAGQSETLTWLAAAHHGYRILVVGSRITLNGEVVTFDKLKEMFA